MRSWNVPGLMALLVLTTQWGSAADPVFDGAILNQIPAKMQEFIDAGKISGAVTLVATKDQIVHLAAVGEADRAAHRPMRTDTIFRIASMTKPITAVGWMTLVAEGRVSPDDPVSAYIPVFDRQKLKDGGAARAVTIRDVLTHTAGLAQPHRERFPDIPLGESVDEVGRTPLAFPPGSQWQYSSGLTVAGRICEVITGDEFSEFLKGRIFDRLGMTDTGFVLTPDQAQRLAVTYKPGAATGALVAVEIPDPTVPKTPNPSGGLYSTAADLAKFYQAVLSDYAGGTPKLLHETRMREMVQHLTPGIVTGFTPGNGWGLGWCVVEHPQGVTRHLSPGTFGHGGAWGTQGWIDPQRGLILVLLIQRTGFGNSDGSDIRDAFTELAATACRGVATETSRFAPFGRYQHAVHLTHGDATAILCPEAGGRVLQFSKGSRQAMYLEDAELTDAGKPSMSAGRFDIGPELTLAPHPVLWSGEWTAEITGPHSARLVSRHDSATGLQLIRDFELTDSRQGARLLCKQTMANVSSEPREACHWGRSFSPGGGICLVPLAGRSRFPSKYAMYEESAIINVRNTDEKIRERDGFLEILAPPRKPKLGFDSTAGWLAYVRPDDTLFVKRFPTYPDRVYGEAAALTLSVWYPDGPRIELEPIGPLERLQPGEVASFTEDWWLLEFPFPKDRQSTDLAKLTEVVKALP